MTTRLRLQLVFIRCINNKLFFDQLHYERRCHGIQHFGDTCLHRPAKHLLAVARKRIYFFSDTLPACFDPAATFRFRHTFRCWIPICCFSRKEGVDDYLCLFSTYLPSYVTLRNFDRLLLQCVVTCLLCFVRYVALCVFKCLHALRYITGLHTAILHFPVYYTDWDYFEWGIFCTDPLLLITLCGSIARIPGCFYYAPTLRCAGLLQGSCALITPTHSLLHGLLADNFDFACLYNWLFFCVFYKDPAFHNFRFFPVVLFFMLA